MSTYHYFLSCGSNLGNRRLHCSQGLEFLSRFGCFVYVSKGIETAPLIHPQISTQNHPPYWNLVAEYVSDLTPLYLYNKIVEIEDKLGHNRRSKWQPRQLDIDILHWSFRQAKSIQLSYQGAGGLIIPHKDLKNRPFLKSLFPL